MCIHQRIQTEKFNNNISIFFFFAVFLIQINVALGSIKDFFQKYTKKSYQPKLLNGTVNAHIHDSKREFS